MGKHHKPKQTATGFLYETLQALKAITALANPFKPKKPAPMHLALIPAQPTRAGRNT